MSPVYTLKEVASIVKKSESTIRNWRSVYADFITVEKVGKVVKYPDMALEVFQFIARAAASKKSKKAIYDALARKFGSIELEETSAEASLKKKQTNDEKYLISRKDLEAVLLRADRLLDTLERIAVILERVFNPEEKSIKRRIIEKLI